MLPDTTCDDCGIETIDDEYYMVTDEVWKLASGKDGRAPRILCIGCLEKRIGRMLTKADFSDAPINDPDRTVMVVTTYESADSVESVARCHQSDRLRDRLAR
jgi:hypothetical protein